MSKAPRTGPPPPESANQVSIRVLGRDYHLAYDAREAHEAHAAAALLNRQLEKLAADVSPQSPEEALLLVALMLAGDLGSCRRDSVQRRENLKKSLDRLREKLAKALDEGR